MLSPTYVKQVSSITFPPLLFKSQQFSMIDTSFSSPLSPHNNLTVVEPFFLYHYLDSARIYQARVVHTEVETL